MLLATIVDVYTYIHIGTYTYIHTCMYTHTYTQRYTDMHHTISHRVRLSIPPLDAL